MPNVSYHSPTERMQVWLDASTLHIRFNNPARHNALSVDMGEAIPVLLTQEEVDDSVRLLVFSGAGEKAFVSAADVWVFEALVAAREAVSGLERMAENAGMRLFPFGSRSRRCIRGYFIAGG